MAAARLSVQVQLPPAEDEETDSSRSADSTVSCRILPGPSNAHHVQNKLGTTVHHASYQFEQAWPRG